MLYVTFNDQKKVKNRFKQLREDEKKNKLSKAARSAEILTLASESDNEDGYDEETSEKVILNVECFFLLLESINPKQNYCNHYCGIKHLALSFVCYTDTSKGRTYIYIIGNC